MSVYNKTGTGGFRNRFVDTQKKFISRNFDKSDGFGEYYITRDGSILTEKTPIQIFTTKTTGEKHFYAHPDYPITKGDIVDYTDDGHNYLVYEKDNHTTVNDYGKLVRMEQTIKWKDLNNNVHEISYFIPKASSGAQDNNFQIPVSESKKQLWIQDNELNRTIYENQRFILGGISVFKVTVLDNYSNTGLLIVTIELTQKMDEDDFVNNIAYNKISIDTIPEDNKNGVYFTKDKLDIPLNSTKELEVYEYLNNVIVPTTTFTFRIDDIDSSEYDIVSTTGNSIQIKSLGYYYSGKLVAINDGDLSEYEIPLTLSSITG